jgi:hypothetical protein
VLGGGQLRLSGTPAELSASPAFVASFLGGPPMSSHPGGFRGVVLPDQHNA